MVFLRFLRRRSSYIAIPAVTCLALGPIAPSVMAVDWDPAVSGGTALGGAGTWDTTTANWWDGAADVVWPNTATSVATFGGAAGGAVTINTGTGVTANSLVFDTTGYVLSGAVPADVLNLAGTTPGIAVTNATDTATINAIIAGTASFTKSGLGTLVLGGANTNSGVVNVNAGTLSIGAATGLGDGSATNTIGFGGGALRTTATMDLGVNRTIAVGAGGGTLSAQTGTILTVSGALSGTGALSAAGGGTVVLSNNNSGFSGNVIVDSIAGNTTNTTLRLSNANALTSGTVTVNPGVAAGGGNGNQVELAGVSIGSGVNLVLDTVTASNARSSLFGGSGTSSWAGGIQLNGDGLAGLNAGTGATLNVSGNITGPSFTGIAFVRGAGTGNINGTINLPTGNLVKTDGGTWNINSTGNTWVNTGISVGTLRMGIANALPSATAVTLGQNDANNATLDLNGFSQTIGSLATNPITGLTGTKTVTSATAATLTINGTANTTYAGVITGASLALVKQGAGIQTLTATNTFGGGTTIDAGGALQLGDKTAGNLVLAAGTAITNNGTLTFAPGTATGPTYNNTITGNGNITLDAATASNPSGVTISGANTGFTGSYTLNQGRMVFATQAAIGATTVPITVNGNATNGGQFWLSGAVAVANPLTLNGYGPLEAAGNLGAVRMAGGTLAGAISLGSNASINPENSNVTISGNISGLPGAQLLYGVPGTARNGNVTVTSPGGNTYVGGTLVRLGTGTLNANVANAVGTGTLRVESGTVSANVLNALGTAPIDLAGGTVRIAAASPTVASAGVAGINASYFNMGVDVVASGNPSQFASFRLVEPTRVFERIDQQINIPNGGGGTHPTVPVPGFQFNVNDAGMWKGLLNVTTAGSYQFSAINDDQAVLFIDGVQVGTIGVNAGGANVGTALNLSAGAHSIVWKFSQGGGGGYTQLRYNGPDTSAATVVVGSVAGSLTNGKLAPSSIGNLQASAGTSTFDTGTDIAAASFSGVGGATLNLTSGTISDIVISGASTLSGGGIVTLNPNTASLTFDGAIGDGGSGTGLTFNGLYLATFKGANTYTGLTTVSGGRLTLDTTGANSIAGNLTINALNALGPVRNVVLNQSNQIADTATVTLQNGILDVGVNNDTIGTLNVSGGRIMGSGTITPTTAISLTGGIVEAGIGGSLGLTKTGSGVVTLSGNSSYTGVTTVNNGALLIGSSNGLGASGTGNGTVVNAGGQLQVQGGSAIGEEISITGTGVSGTGALKNLTGTNSITPALTLSGAASIESGGGSLDLIGGVATGGSALTVQGSGEIIITGAVTGGGGITKIGNGTLTFNQNMSSLAGVTHTAGALGFNGAQSFGASTVGAGLAYKFNSDPGAGVNITAAAGGAFIAGYAADQTLLSRVNTASAGAFALGANSSNNLDFSAHPTLGLGASGLATYSGTITPNAAGYRFGGAPASGLTPNILRLTNPLTGANAVTVTGGTLDLIGLNSTQTGAITVTGGTLRIQNNMELGAASNSVNLNGGTLEYAANSPNNGNLWFQLGNVLGGGQRTVNIGAAGGTISVSSFGYGNTLLGLSGVDPLTGSGTLTKTGFGHLFLNDSSSFSGNIVVAAQSANFEMRSKGSLSNVASVEVNQSSNFVVDNQNGWGQRQFGNPTNNQNRVNDAAVITLKGGQLLYRSRNAAGQIVETFGTVANPEGQNIIRLEKNGTVGGEILITNFNRPVGGGTVRFEKNGGTFGSTGDNPRIFLTNVNGVAPGTVNQLGGWAYNSTDFQFVGYGANGIVNSTNTDQGAAAFTPAVSTNVLNLNAAGTATLQNAAGNAHNIAALRFGNNAAQTLAFTDGANDVLYIASGGILNDNNNQARTIGSTAQRGKITAGTSTAAAGAKELFFHVNQNTTTVESVIVDNNGAVTVVKDLGGNLNLNTANTYSGGTNLFAGRINVAVAGGLGSGAVLVKGAALQLNQPGATTSAAGVITGKDGSEIYIQNATGVYNTTGDRFVIEGGSGITGNSNNAGQNLASLTRIDVGTAFTAGGQVKLFPNAVVRSVNTVDGNIMTNMIGNLGANADLYFNQSGGGGSNQFITVGQGTPWKGLSSSVSTSGWNQGVINATSDFYLQGLTRLGGNVTLQLGNGSSAGTYAINNIAGKPINAFVEGQVLMNEDSPVNISSDITFVVGAGGYLQPNFTNSFGSQAGNLNAKLVVQAGGTVDPGNYVAVGLAANQAQGFPYPVPSPVNTNAIFEAGGRLLINDASGIGSTTGGATYTFKSNSILELGNSQAFLGSAAGGLVNSDQFVYDPGAIIRLSGDRIFKQDAFVNAQPNGTNTVLQIYGGSRSVTDAVDPRIVAAVGTPTVVPMTLTFDSQGMITNDSADRTINERRGGFVLEDGATIAATSQTVFNVQESVTVAAGSTLNIGSSRYVDGNPKTGLVQFTGPASNVFGAGAKLVVHDGSAFSFNGTHTFPDSGAIELPGTVTNLAPTGAIGFNPGNGSTLLINTDNYMEVMGTLTGNGSVIGNVGTPVFAPGFDATSDFTFAGGVRNANTRNPHMVKVGSTKMTLTGLNDTQGILAVAEGELVLAGPNGKWAGGEFRISKGGTLTFDNTVNAVADRQAATGGGANRWLTTLGGGEFRLLGNATTAADVTMFGLANSAGGHVSYGGNMGGFGKVTVVPNGDLTALRTSLTLGTIERFDNTGERNSAWLLRGVGLAGLPGSYNAAGVYAANTSNPKDGLIFITDPNFTAGGVYDASGNATGIVFGAPGSSVAPTSGLLLGATSPTSTEGSFVTIDVASGASRTGVRLLQASEYTNTLQKTNNAFTSLNVQATGALTATGNSRFQVLKLEDNSSLTVSGSLPATTQPSQVLLSGGGILVPSGATATISSSDNGAGADSVFRTPNGVSAYVHSFGNLNVDGEFFSDIGLVKTGTGTATFAAGSLDNLRGRIALHEGTLNINDSLANVRAAAISAFAFQGIHLELNGGTLNLNGKSQLFGRLESGNFLAGATTEGGTITSVNPATITVTDGGGFDGHIAGAISYDKIGNNTHTLHNSNPYTGTTTVRQGTLLLRANATLANTSEVNLNYARIDIDDGHLAYIEDRINPNAVINMRGGDFVNRGRAGTLTKQHLGTVNLLAGTNLFQTLAGGGGATETYIGTLNRSLGTSASFQQNYGFMGTNGNDTTAIRYLINNISVNGGAATTPAALMAANNGILGGWAIANNDNFAVYDAVRGIGAMGNTEDGFANYNSGDLSTATATQNVNDGTARTIATSKTVNSFRFAGGVTMTIGAGQTLTLNTGGLLAVGNTAKVITGGSLTSNSGELNVWVNENTLTLATQITGNIALTKGGSQILKLQGPGNNYTGATYVGAGNGGISNRGGDLQLDVTGANGTTVVAIPGDLHIHQTQVTELQPSQIAQTSNVYLYGGAILSLRDAAGITETLNSINFLHAGGQDFNRPSVIRANTQATSTLNLTGAIPISSDNSNPVDIPGFHGQVGNLAFTGANGSPQTLMVNSPVTVNGLAAAGLLIDPIITQVPTGVDDGGLVKAGTGMLVLRGVNTFGAPASPTEVFNIQNGFVRADGNGALGTVNSITTVQNGAVLLLNGTTGLTGSLQMKNGSELGVTLANPTIGAVGSTGTLDVPASATTTVGVLDYFAPSTNMGNIVVNHQLTGSGTINLRGIEYAAGYNAGGLFQLRNEVNSFSGNININTNTILESSTNGADLTGSAFGTATLNLNGGVLRIRDAGNNLAGAQTVTYGNTVNLNSDSMIDLDRLGTVANQKTIALGTLNVGSGTKTLSTPYGTGASITPNDYRIAFSQVAGAGTLVKGGSRFMDINGYDGGFSGNITVAGPKGLSLPTSGNLTLNAATNNLNTFSVGGFHNFAAGKTVTMQTFHVGNNAGEVANGLGGITKGGIVGVATLNSTSAVTANLVRNEGIIASNNSAATLNATSITGSGKYHAYGANLTLNGTLANDGANPTTLRVTGATAGNAVILTSSASGTNTGGAEVQGGTLRVAPTGGTVVNPLGSGAIRVLGSAATTLAAGSQPVAAQNATLEFAGSSISQAGNITNTGTVRVASGTTTISGVISGTPGISSNLADFQAATVPGLLEGRLTTTGGLPDTDANGRVLTATRSANPGNFGIQMEPRMGQTNVVTGNGLTGWSDNTAWIYTGYFYDADGVFTFMENIDDQTLVSIDGVTRLLNNGNNVTSTATTVGQRGSTLSTGAINTAAAGDLITAATPLAANPNLPAGWHTIEIRFENGAGGAGPWVDAATANGFTNNYGFGLNPDGTMTLDGTQAFRPIDPGDGTLFRTAAAGKGTVSVDTTSTLNAGGVTLTKEINLNGGTTTGTEAVINLTNTSFASSSDSVNVVGAGAKGIVNAASGHVLSTQAINVAAGGDLKVTGAATGELRLLSGGAGANGNVTGTFTVSGGMFNITSGATLTNTQTVTAEGGEFKVNGTATAADVLVAAGGTLSGSGVVNANITQTGGIISPGNSPGLLTANGNIISSGGSFVFDIAGTTPVTGYDQFNVAGTIDLGLTTVLTLNITSTPAFGDKYFLITNDDVDSINGIFAGIADGLQFTSGGYEFVAHYNADSSSGNLSGGNDFALMAVPEPGAAFLLLSTGFLCFFRRRRRE